MKTIFPVLIIIALALAGCNTDAGEKLKKDFMPIARGENDEIILVIDSAQWKAGIGDELRKTYQQYMMLLPQDEYEFSVNKVNPRKLNDVFRHAKNMIFVMTLDSKTAESRAVREYFTDNSLKKIQQDSSIFYTVRRDEFAKGQIVLYLFGQDAETLERRIGDNRAALKSLFASAVRERTRDEILAKPKKETIAAIEENHPYSIQVPFGYDLAKNLPNFIWLRKLDSQSEWNVFVYEGDYTDRGVFNKVDEFRDEITSTYLRDSEKPEIFIKRQPEVPVLTQRVTFKDMFAVESRGLWKISDSSGGGPYVSYTFVDEKTQKIYYIEGYVYSPPTKKKHLIREVEAILSTFELKKPVVAN
ncbi:MAG: hypothetical protein CMP48_04385 [Rickettsiales bacterium]|nr:hypothetical protein [Rickettsiales bacterium]